MFYLSVVAFINTVIVIGIYCCVFVFIYFIIYILRWVWFRHRWFGNVLNSPHTCKIYATSGARPWINCCKFFFIVCHLPPSILKSPHPGIVRRDWSGPEDETWRCQRCLQICKSNAKQIKNSIWGAVLEKEKKQKKTRSAFYFDL